MPSLAKLSGEQIPVYKQTELFNKCLTKVIYPTGNVKLQDGNAHLGRRELQGVLVQPGRPVGHRAGLRRQRRLHEVPGRQQRPDARLAGRPRWSNTKLQGLKLLARSPLPPLGTRPAYPAEEPPYQPLVPCYTQTLPEFNGPLSNGPADGSE